MHSIKLSLVFVVVVISSAAGNNGTVVVGKDVRNSLVLVSGGVIAPSAKPQKTTISASPSAPQFVRRHRQTPKHKVGDQLASSSGRKSRQAYNQRDEKPKSYSFSYNSGPQYYESTSKPVKYYREYHSPPASYSKSYNSGPQGYSHHSPPQQSSHRDSYNNQDSNEYRDGDSSSTGDHREYGDNDGYGGGGGDEYGASDFENDEGYGGNGGGDIEY